MALKPCKSCNQEIDSSAKTCPQCGATNQGAYAGVRFAGLIYLALIGALFYWIWGLMSPTPPAMPAADYKVIQDESHGAVKRTVEVLLPRRVSEEELAAIAKEIKAQARQSTDRTFISYRVAGQADSGYWANASFTPDYQGNVIGTSAEDYEALRAVDMSGYEEVLGSWLQDGALGHVMVLYRKGGNHFIDQVFPSGAKNTSGYLAKQVAGGDLRLEEPENDFGEFYLLKADGTLEGWSENGRYLSLVPMVR